MTRHQRRLLLVLFMLIFGGAPFASGLSQAADYPSYQGLDQGRSLWIDTCEGCHGYGIAGAPIPMEAADWAPRLNKPVSELYDHAINGFFGPDDTMMPARGGNDALSDSEVKAAVDYMLELARQYQTTH